MFQNTQLQDFFLLNSSVRIERLSREDWIVKDIFDEFVQIMSINVCYKNYSQLIWQRYEKLDHKSH